jgi:hypothetical protein
VAGATVLITGSRDWSDFDRIRQVILPIFTWLTSEGEYSGVVICHGAARGADSIANYICKQAGYIAKPYKANWELLGKKAGVLRNQQMLDENEIDLCLAFSNDLENSRGTRDMTNRCLKKNIPVFLFGEKNGRT